MRSIIKAFPGSLFLLGLAVLLFSACVYVPPRPPIPRAPRPGYQWRWDARMSVWVETSEADLERERAERERERASKAERERQARIQAWRNAASPINVTVQQLFQNPRAYLSRQVVFQVRGPLQFQAQGTNRYRALLIPYGNVMLQVYVFAPGNFGQRALVNFRNQYSLEPYVYSGNLARLYSAAGTLTLKGLVFAQGNFRQLARGRWQNYFSVSIYLVAQNIQWDGTTTQPAPPLPQPEPEPQPLPEPEPEPQPLPEPEPEPQPEAPRDLVVQGSYVALSGEPHSGVIRPGETVDFYFKMGNILYMAGKGASFRSRLTVMRANRLVKDYGWRKDYAYEPQPGVQTQYTEGYENSAWSFTADEATHPGRYTAVLTFQDLNSGRSTNISYTFNVMGKRPERPPRPKPQPQPEPPASKSLVIQQAFLSSTNRTNNLMPHNTMLRPGETVYCYFKIGNILYKQNRGAPVRTHLVLKRGNQLLRDYGWRETHAFAPQPGLPTQYVDGYQNAKWSLSSDQLNPGRYTAVLTFQDVNAGTSVDINYPFSVNRGTPKPPKKPDPRPHPKPGPKKPDPKPHPKPGPKKPDPKPHPQPGPKKPDPKPHPQPGPKKPDPKPHPQPGPKKPDPKPQPKPGPKKPGPKPEPEPPKPAPSDPPAAQGHWVRYKMDVAQKKDAGKNNEVSYMGREGNLTVTRRFQTNKKKDVSRVVENLKFTVPPASLSAGTPLRITATPRLMIFEGKKGSRGHFIADLTFEAKRSPAKLGDFQLGRNKGGNRNDHYSWLVFPNGTVNVPAPAPNRTEFTVRIGFSDLSGKVYYFFLYQYKWEAK